VKTVLELLGHSDECGTNCCCNNLDESTHAVLTCVAQRAREEMREAAADEALKQYVERRPVLEERKAIAERIRALPVTP
jgi:hypothetical protein